MADKKITLEELRERLERSEKDLAALCAAVGGSADGDMDAFIHEAAAAREREAHIKQVLLAIRDVNQLIVKAAHPVGLIEEACDALTETLGYRRAWILLVDETSGTISEVAGSSRKESFEVFRSRLLEGDLPQCVSEIIDKGKSLSIVQHDRICSTGCPLNDSQDDLSVLVSEMRFDERCYGVLGVSVAADIAFDQEIKELLREVAGDLAYALHSMQQRRRSDAAEVEVNAILSSISDAFMALNNDMVFTWFNPAAEDQLGRSAEDVVGKKFEDAFPEAVGSIFEKKYREALRTRKTMHFETFFDREPYRNWYDVRVFPHEQGIAVYFMVTTERHEREEQLRFQQLMLEQIQDLVTVTDMHGKITYANEAVCNKLGTTLENLVGKDIWALGEDPVEGATQDEILRETLDKGAWRGQVINFASDGRRVILDSRTHLIRNEQGVPVSLAGISTDVTERVLAERNYRRVFELASEMICIVDLDTRKYLQVNPAFVSILGYDTDELIGAAFPDIIDPADREETLSLVEQQLREEHEDVSFQVRMTCKDGAFRLIKWNAHPILSEGIAYALGLDITEQNAYESALLESEQRFRSFVENANDIVYAVNPEGIFTYISPNWQRYMGEPAEEGLGRSFREYVHPEDVHLCQEFLEKALREKQPQASVEYRVRTRQGDWRWHVSNGGPLFDAEGRASSYIGIARDVTEEKIDQERLRESERKYRDLFETAPVGIFAAHSDGRILTINPAMAELVGCSSPREALDYYSDIATQLYVNPRRRDEMLEQMREKRYVENFEYEIRTKKAEYLWLELTARVMAEDEQGMTMHGFAINITSRKEAETARRHSEARYRNLAETMRDIIILHDMDGVIEYVNPAGAKLIGYSEEQLVGSNVVDYLPEDQLAPLNRHRRRRLDGDKGAFLYEMDFINASGERIPLEVSTSIINDEEDREKILVVARNITERKRAKAEQEKLSLAIEQASETVIITDAGGTIEYVNPAFEMFSGFSREEATGRHISMIQSDEHDDVFHRLLWQTISRGEVWEGRCVNRRKDGSLHTELVTISPMRDREGNITNFVSVQRDVTHEMQLEEQYRQAQKMEAIGQLTGGVAHDFNNLLQVISAGNELALDDLDEDHPAREALAEVRKAGERATSLVSQLLAFSRRQIMRMDVVDLNTIVGDLLKMVGRIIGETIRLEWLPGRNVGFINADRGMIEQVIMNMAVNSRDAMPGHGVLTLETQNVLIDSQYCDTHAWATPGRYVMLSISDTGCGMDAETLEHVFEPFYTTKEVGKGTGLGLATVYGIIRQHDGMINVYSEPGSGTTFKIYFPIAERKARTVGPMIEAEPSGGSETILIAEDDEMVRNLARRILRRAGYTVLSTSDGAEALEVFREDPDAVDLVLLDVVMPEMGGRKALKEMLAIRPDLKALFCSGYSENAIHTNFVLEEGLKLLPKPYAPASLLRRVREILDDE